MKMYSLLKSIEHLVFFLYYSILKSKSQLLFDKYKIMKMDRNSLRITQDNGIRIYHMAVPDTAVNIIIERKEHAFRIRRFFSNIGK